MELRAALNTLRWTQAFVARECGYTRQAADRWLNGTARIPEPVEDWLEARMNGDLIDPPKRLAYEY
jgi:transcriptional regulator with XRE-family HTH domain